MAPSASRSSRVDAVRNRARLVASARELFATEGTAVGVREVARRAGVGVATLYRHFPTREELVDAVLEEASAEFLAVGDAALAADDAWAGFRSFVENGLLLHARNRGLRDLTEARARGGTQVAATRLQYRALVARIVERAQAEGTLRPDFAAQDVSLLFWAADRLIDLARDVRPEIWRRQLEFVFDGLRSEAAHRLTEPPLTYAELDRLSGRRS